MLAVLSLCAAGAANRVLFETAHGLGAFCQSAGTTGAVALSVGASHQAALRSDIFCNPTGIQLERGVRYSIRLALPGAGGWRDGSIGVRSPAGFNGWSAGLTPRERVFMTATAPFRRMWSVGWFAPVARIGERGFDQYPMTGIENAFTARKTGELFLFVNDAIAPIGFSPFAAGWQSSYANNAGTATVTISKLSALP